MQLSLGTPRLRMKSIGRHFDGLHDGGLKCRSPEELVPASVSEWEVSNIRRAAQTRLRGISDRAAGASCIA